MPEKVAARWFSARRLTMQGLKPSDYYLYKSMKEFFQFDMRGLVVLGLRNLYSDAHDPITRQRILTLAAQIQQEDLDQEQQRPEYRSFNDLMRTPQD